MKKTLTLLCFLLSFLSLSAQEITGVVMASDSPDPVIGANVTIKGTSTGTITDFDGNFILTAKTGDVLVVSFMGYKTQEIAVKSATPIRVTLQPDNVLLQEVVAVGYGTMKKADLTGSVASVSAEDLMKAPVSGLDQALQGRAAGVTVVSNSGQPGAAAEIRIRGIGSALGSNAPLYVVDGVITSDISFLSPNDIKSMDILKDASAAAIYGSRGANGVILITTKTGGDGKANISFDAYWGMQNRWKKLDLMSAQEQADTKTRIGAMKNGAEEIAYYQQNGFNKWMSLYNTGKSPYFPTIYDPVNNPTGFDYASQETDWQDEVFNPNAFMQNYNLAIDGGNDKGHYAFSANYFQQEGTIIGSNYQRLTLRFNSDYKVREWLTIGEHLSFATSRSRWAMNNSSSAGASVISAALAMAPWDPTHYPEGSVNAKGEDISGKNAASSNFKNVTNPFSMVSESFPNAVSERLLGDIFIEIRPVEGLTLKSSISMDMTWGRDRSFKNAYNYSSYDQSTKNFLSSSMSRNCSLLEETTLTYAKEIDKHNFSVMVGQTWQEVNYYSIGGAGSSIMNPTEENWYLSNTTEDRTFASDGVSRLRRLSFLGRAFYSYDNRYMATVNFRADASSRFTKQPWGFFPSMSLAWRLSQESFMEGAAGWLDNLKLRAGYGRVGNDDIPNGAFIPTMGTGMDVFYGYPLGTTPVVQPGAAVLTQVNLDGKWETNEQWDAAVDFSFWGSKLSGTVEYFRRNTLDALMYVKAPAHVGNRYDLIRNVGLIRNEGFEVSLDHRHTVGKFSYNVGGNVSYIKNMLVETNGGSPLWGDRTKTDQGMPLNSFWGYVYEGIYQSDDEALAHLYSYTSETIGVHAGDAKYKDLNEDGKIDDNDQTYIGNPFPKFTYGLSLGADFYGVDIQLFFQGVHGNSVYNALRLRTEGAGDECTLSTSMRDVWVGYSPIIQESLMKAGVNYYTLENREGTIPNPVGSSMNTENSSRFIEDGSYFRLKNLQIGYTLPKDITKKFYVDRLRVYMTASNLFTLTKYSGYDPEVGTYAVDYGNYPQSRTFTFGLNVNL